MEEINLSMLLSLFGKYGITPILIAFFGVFMIMMFKSHRDERREWRDDSQRFLAKIIEVTSETKLVISANTSAIEEMKSVIKDLCYEIRSKK